MNFYGREQELAQLAEIQERSHNIAQMTLMVGRRRIGKTHLILKSLEGQKFLYFFVAKKNEKLLCEEFVNEAKNTLNIPIFGEITRFRDLFALLVEKSKQEHLTLVIDEFQEFNNINPAIYSEMQDVWDRNKPQSKMNLILCGSIYSLMKKIFESAKEPLFGRANEKIHLKPFDVDTLKQIMTIYAPGYTQKDLLAFYMLTGGVAKYVELLTDTSALTYNQMLDRIFCNNSMFIDEGKNLLIEKFGKEYQNYFSILSLIASSKTSRTDMESILNKNVGGYLDKLENEYNIIKKVKPLFAKPGSRIIKYYIDDNLLNFWFRFIYKYRSAVEIENYAYLKEIVTRDFDIFSGGYLEKFITQKLQLSKKYNLIGNYWEKGNQNEIDIIALNEMDKTMLIAEVKLNESKLKINQLKEKAIAIVSKFSEYSIEYKGFSLNDIWSGEVNSTKA